MKRKVLITGGAGFIGSHLGDELVAHGHVVRVLDNLTPRVHAGTGAGACGGERPPTLNPAAEWMAGDIRDGTVVERALEGIDVVVHLAAAVGAGESLFESERCISVNYVGTAVLVDCLRRRPVERLILGSSMAVYGEGLYEDEAGALREVKRRPPEQLRRGSWDPEPRPLKPIATPETKTPSAFTVYARSKFDQERVCWRFGYLTGMPTTILRFFNVYGARQSSASPYSGDLESFIMLLLRGRCPLLPEDGEQLRDFVHVRDVVAACRRAVEHDTAVRGVMNVGSGRACSLIDVARTLAELTGRSDLEPQPSGRYNLTDVRHCFADVERAEQRLGYRSTVNLRDGLEDLVKWVERTSPPRGQSKRPAALDTVRVL